MTKSLRLLVVSLFLLLIPVAAKASFDNHLSLEKTPPLNNATYDGEWSGVVKCLYDPGLWPDDECDVTFVFSINGDSLSVEATFRSKDGKTTKSKIYPGKFKFVRLSTNAVAFAQGSGNDEDGTWVETWEFTMTLKDPDHMIVHWTRVVNNMDMSTNNKFSKFSIVGMGELVRADYKK